MDKTYMSENALAKGSDPHILSLIELADYLNVTIDYLVGRAN